MSSEEVILPANVASLLLIDIGASVIVFESDHITTSFAVPEPSTAPPPIGISTTCPVDVTPSLCVTVPVMLPLP